MNKAKSPKGPQVASKDFREPPEASQLVLTPRDQAMVAGINRWYDRRMFEPRMRNTEFANYGYWERHTRTCQEACESLMEKLLAFIPEKKGAILDVACGKGGTTRYLLKYYRPEDVTGINISQKQLQRCIAIAPGCNFVLMSATELDFDDNSFDNILCVESVFHFNTRETFLQEALRVLKPGGRLVLSDILLRRLAYAHSSLKVLENYVPDLRHYNELYSRTGFRDVQVIDATLESWVRIYRRAMSAAIRSFRAYQIGRDSFWRRVAWLQRKRKRIMRYLLVSAEKSADRN